MTMLGWSPNMLVWTLHVYSSTHLAPKTLMGPAHHGSPLILGQAECHWSIQCTHASGPWSADCSYILILAIYLAFSKWLAHHPCDTLCADVPVGPCSADSSYLPFLWNSMKELKASIMASFGTMWHLPLLNNASGTMSVL